MLTIMVLAYNQEDIIENTIDSLLKQKTDCPFKILISDDLSTDSTYSILKKIESENDNVKVICVNEKKALGHNRNNLVKNVQTEYCCYVDGDDPQEDDYVQKIYEQIKQKDSDVYKVKFLDQVYSDHTHRVAGKELLLFALFVVKTDIYKKYMVNETLRSGDDLEFFIRNYLIFFSNVIEIDTAYKINRKNENISITSKMNAIENYNIVLEVHNLVKHFETSDKNVSKIINLRKIHLINYALLAGVTPPVLEVKLENIKFKYKISYICYKILPRKLYCVLIKKVLQ